jgi:hypothetical protein
MVSLQLQCGDSSAVPERGFRQRHGTFEEAHLNPSIASIAIHARSLIHSHICRIESHLTPSLMPVTTRAGRPTYTYSTCSWTPNGTGGVDMCEHKKQSHPRHMNRIVSNIGNPSRRLCILLVACLITRPSFPLPHKPVLPPSRASILPLRRRRAQLSLTTSSRANTTGRVLPANPAVLSLQRACGVETVASRLLLLLKRPCD